MTFLYPWWFVAVMPLAALLWWLHRRSVHPMSGFRCRLDLSLRLMAMLGLVSALAGPHYFYHEDAEALMIILDHSDSVGDEGWSAATDQARTLARQWSGPVGVVSAGAHAQLLVSPQVGSRIPDDMVRPERDHHETNIAAAMRLAVAVRPPGMGLRLLVLSDGWSTAGQPEYMAQWAATQGVRIDAVPLAGSQRPDARISSVSTNTDRLHLGATLSLTARVSSTIVGPAQLRLFENGLAVSERNIELQPGADQVIGFERQPQQQGIATYRLVLVAPESDEMPSNNTAMAYVDVRGQPNALVLTSDREGIRQFAQSMQQEGIRLVTRPPPAMPSDLTGLLSFDCVILVNVAAHQLGPDRMQLLRDYVEQLGGGLLVVGGDKSFGAGGYYRTAIEPILPVKMRPKDTEEKKPTALALVLDRSGSMGGDKMAQCKAAAMVTAQMLSSKDYLSVVAFDSSAYQIVPMGRVNAGVEAAIASITSEGGTNIFAGMQAGFQALSTAPAGIKHMIVLTDGQGNGGDVFSLAQQMQRNGITVSTVAVGGSADVASLQQIAALGQGTCYTQVNPQDLKAVFTEDTMRHLGRHIREEPFTPVQAEDHPMLAGFDGNAPVLLGYVRTERRSTSQVPLVTDIGDPLLAHWRFGLGKVTAFTSAVDARWAPVWVAGWPGFAPFWAQVIRETMRPPQGQLLDVTVAAEGSMARVAVDVMEDAAHFAHGRQVEASLFHLPVGRLGSALQEVGTIICDQRGIGHYEARFPLDASGIYIAQVRTGARFASAGLVHETSSETARGRANLPGLEAIIQPSNGVLLSNQTDTLPPSAAVGQGHQLLHNLTPLLIALALMVLFINVIVRRYEHVLGIADFFSSRSG